MTLGVSSSWKRLARDERGASEAIRRSDGPWYDRLPSKSPTSDRLRFGGVILLGDSNNSLLARATAFGEGDLSLSRPFLGSTFFDSDVPFRGLFVFFGIASSWSVTETGDCAWRRLSTLSTDRWRRRDEESACSSWCDAPSVLYFDFSFLRRDLLLCSDDTSIVKGQWWTLFPCSRLQKRRLWKDNDLTVKLQCEGNGEDHKQSGHLMWMLFQR